MNIYKIANKFFIGFTANIASTTFQRSKYLMIVKWIVYNGKTYTNNFFFVTCIFGYPNPNQKDRNIREKALIIHEVKRTFKASFKATPSITMHQKTSE